MSVTVLITCFNEGPYIEQALNSVLNQTAAAAIDAIHILDDGSATETLSKLRWLEGRDPRLTIHYGSSEGVAINRNRGVTLATGDFVAFLDGDDYWIPDKLERQLMLLEQHPEYSLVYGGYFAFSESDDTQQSTVNVVDLAEVKDQPLRYYLHGPAIFPSSVLMRRSAFSLLDENFVKDCSPFEDFDLFWRLSRKTRFKGISAPVFHKRYRTGSLSSRSPQLMMRHAFVAFRAAAYDPRFLSLAPRRISERARRLAMIYLYAGEIEVARQLASTALQAHCLAPKTWATWALTLGGKASQQLLTIAFPSRTRQHL